MERRFASAGEVARMFNLTAPTVRELLRRGEMPGGIRIGRRWRVDLAALESHLAQKTEAGPNIP
jgi:excisionase family DNA binding protein